GPRAVVVDDDGNLFIADAGNARIRKVDAATGRIATIAGTGVAGYNGDGIPAVTAQVSLVTALAVDHAGNLYLSDVTSERVRRIDAATGLISTVAGTGAGGFNGDGIAANTAQLNGPEGLALSDAGDLYIADRNNGRVRAVSAATGLIGTVTAAFPLPTGLALDHAGTLYVGGPGSTVARLDPASGGLVVFAGTGVAGYDGDGKLASTARLNAPFGLAVGPDCRVYVADTSNHRIREIDPLQFTAALALTPRVAPVGTLVEAVLTVTNTGAESLSNVLPALQVDAGGALVIQRTGPLPPGPAALPYRAVQSFTWTFSVTGAGGVRLTATGTGVDDATGFTVSAFASRTLETFASCLSDVGRIFTVAGNGSAGFAGDGFPATGAQVNGALVVVLDAYGNQYVADAGNHRVRRISAATGTITTLEV
ncbi:MAG: hypothetical protein AAB368_11350, partial [bacterium]